MLGAASCAVWSYASSLCVQFIADPRNSDGVCVVGTGFFIECRARRGARPARAYCSRPDAVLYDKAQRSSFDLVGARIQAGISFGRERTGPEAATAKARHG